MSKKGILGIIKIIFYKGFVLKDKKRKALLIKSYDNALYEKSPKEYYIKNAQFLYNCICKCTLKGFKEQYMLNPLQTQ